MDKQYHAWMRDPHQELGIFATLPKAKKAIADYFDTHGGKGGRSAWVWSDGHPVWYHFPRTSLRKDNSHAS